MDKDLNRYVKVEGSDILHPTLQALSEMCETVTEETAQLKNLEKEKHRWFAEARSIGRALISDLSKLNSHLNEKPVRHTISKPTAPKKARAKKRTKPKSVKGTKQVAKKQVSKKAKATKKTVQRPQEEDHTEALRRLKANLDAIRSSLK